MSQMWEQESSKPSKTTTTSWRAVFGKRFGKSSVTSFLKKAL